MKIIFIFFVACIIADQIYGQHTALAESEQHYSKLRIGVKAGLLLAGFNDLSRDGYDQKKILRFRTGLFAHIPISERTALRPELVLSGKGTAYEDNFQTKDLITYMEFPVNLLYRVTTQKGFLFIGGGPAPAIATGQESYNFMQTLFQKFDLGINAMAAYEGLLGFSINIHYTHGLVNISKDKSIQPVIKNRCFGLSLGYLF